MTALAILAQIAGHVGRAAPAHSPLWIDMAASYPWLLVATNGVRLVTAVLAIAVLMLWPASAVRCLAHRHAEMIAARLAGRPFGLAVLGALLHPPREGDSRRAGYVPLAIGVLIFEARWFVTVLSELGRAQLALAGQVAIFLTLAYAISAHGRAYRGLSWGRAVAALALMLFAGVGAAAVMR